ncbi:MAG: AbgT family transporter [Thermoanaerobaculia bacterium]|nr:AbgT family transporter [Thermoanaerobaculia bacterium]
MSATDSATKPNKSFMNRFLDLVEMAGNRLPDPAMLFLILMFVTWGLSALLAPVAFSEVHPATGEPIRIINQLSGVSLAGFLANMVKTFTGFHPLGVVLVALLGVGVAEHTGFINAGLKWMLGFTHPRLLTPVLILVAVVSHTAADAGYVLVIPLGGVIFYAAGRHPLAGIAAAFAGVSGGFSANFIPSGIDPLLQGLTQAGAQIVEPGLQINPLCNWAFTSASTILVVLVGWWLTDRVVEPRLAGTKVDGDPADMPAMDPLTAPERRGFYAGTAALLICLGILIAVTLPVDSPLRSPDGEITAFAAPLMQSIVPLIFIFFLIPGVVHGLVAGTVKSSKDIVDGMSSAMGTMAYYLVMAFFAAQFIAAFAQSNVGVLLAVKGANFLKDAGASGQVTIVGIVLLTAVVNLFVGSASAKWALLAPIFVPMLMALGYSPELTQAAYRVGDSTTNIITPLMPYFPLVVVFAQRYVKKTGIGTIAAMMLPYSITLLITWTLFLLAYWAFGLPLGLQAGYVYPAG